MKPMYIIAVAALLLLAGLGVALLTGDKSEGQYSHTMASIRSEHQASSVIEIIGVAEEPYRKSIPIVIAGVEDGSGSLVVGTAEQPQHKHYEAIPGYLTVAHPYFSTDGQVVYVIEKRAKND